MKKLIFSELSPEQKRLIYFLSKEFAATTPMILASARHVGELWEAQAFYFAYQQESHLKKCLTERLGQGSESAESILATIKRIAPDYVTLGEEPIQFRTQTDTLPLTETAGIA